MINIDLIVDEALERYPDVKPFLNYENEYQFLIMVILSARTTDKIINRISKDLFKKYKDFVSLSEANQEDLEQMIHEAGFYINKAKNIIQCSKMIIKNFNNTIPDNMSDFITLPGVGRKTANVILGSLFNKPSIIVDTHFTRVVTRHGITKENTPFKIEMDLKQKIKPEKQYRFSMAINKHGREICTYRNKFCKNCFLETFSPRLDLRTN